MKDLLKILPDYIETPILLALIVGVYKLYEFYKKKKKETQESQEQYKEQIIEEQKVKAELENRLGEVEKDLERVREEIKEHKISYNIGFKELSDKIDKINEMLMNFLTVKQK